MTTSYWVEAAHADQEATRQSLEYYQRRSQAAMQDFLQEFPGAPCMLGPEWHVVSFSLDFQGITLAVVPIYPLHSTGKGWQLCHPNGGTSFLGVGKHAAGLYRACRMLCPASVPREPDMGGDHP